MRRYRFSKTEYVAFAMTAERLKKEKNDEAGQVAVTLTSRAPVNSTEQGRLKMKMLTYGESRWSDDESDMATTFSHDLYREEAQRCFKACRRMQVDWAREFPERDLEPPIDAVSDLMSLDVGHIYRRLKQDEHKTYGYLPVMAGCSVGWIGALNAESFCERVLSCASNVLRA